MTNEPTQADKLTKAAAAFFKAATKHSRTITMSAIIAKEIELIVLLARQEEEASRTDRRQT